VARIAGVEIPRNKRVDVALTYIYGIGKARAKEALEKTGINPATRVKDLTEAEVVRLREYVENTWKLEGELRAEVAAKISGPESSFTRKVALGNASVTTPSVRMVSFSFAIPLPTRPAPGRPR